MGHAILVEVKRNPETGLYEYGSSNVPLRHAFEASITAQGILDQVSALTGNDKVMFHVSERDAECC